MKFLSKTLSVFLFSFLLMSLPSALQAALFSTTSPSGEKQVTAIPKLNPDMTQGQFARWLSYAIGAMGPQSMGPNTMLHGPLSPASSGKDAIEFLTEELNVEPEGGWNEDEKVSREFLARILGYPDDMSKNQADEIMSLVQGDDPDGSKFNKLADMVEDYAGSRFDDRKAAVFRVQGGGSESYPGSKKPNYAQGPNLHPV
ncbi:MAG TPA: hypothetical protein VD913_03380 [bacterium]|nr:hypothetical protein [bacterium]